MTDIKQAIGELREAVEQDFSFGLMNPRFCAVEIELEKIYGVNHPMQVIARMDAALCRGIYDKNGVLAALNRLESAVDGGTVEVHGVAKCPVCNGTMIVPAGFYTQTSGEWSSGGGVEKCRNCNATGIITSSPTPSLTERITAAAEEIDSKIVQADGVTMPVPDITAIIRRHIEGGK